MPDKSADAEREKARDLLRKVAEERASIPEEQKIETATPRKYVAPIGLNDKGEPLPPAASEGSKT